jgi:hypothetical protein
MQKIKNRTYQTVKWATIIGAGTTFGALGGLFSYVFGGLSHGMSVAYLTGAAGVLLASTVSTTVASLAFKRD